MKCTCIFKRLRESHAPEKEGLTQSLKERLIEAHAPEKECFTQSLKEKLALLGILWAHISPVISRVHPKWLSVPYMLSLQTVLALNFA